eukprot:scaffold551371_cov16-Prasinocladus_malaysianus.AAC.1
MATDLGACSLWHTADSTKCRETSLIGITVSGPQWTKPNHSHAVVRKLDRNGYLNARQEPLNAAMFSLRIRNHPSKPQLNFSLRNNQQHRLSLAKALYSQRTVIEGMFGDRTEHQDLDAVGHHGLDCPIT